VSVAILFALIVAGIAAWWLIASRLTGKPWEKAQSEADNEFAGAALAFAPAQVGLWMFLAVVTSLFALLVSAYGMRMEVGDWRPLAMPKILWLNTAVLALSSAAFQWTRVAARHGEAERVKGGLLASGVFAIAFVAGQLLAWQQLYASGQFLASNIASAFFFLLTGLHGLHLLGGLVVWSRSTARMWGGRAKLADIRMSIELCAVYWHYLLAVWLLLFALLLSRTTLRNLWLGICSAVGYGP